MSNDLNLSRQLCELCGIEKTVDFTKSENFVRLLELITRRTKEQNLETMFNHLKVNIYPYTEQTKQSIREAEWVYE